MNRILSFVVSAALALTADDLPAAGKVAGAVQSRNALYASWRLVPDISDSYDPVVSHLDLTPARMRALLRHVYVEDVKPAGSDVSVVVSLPAGRQQGGVLRLDGRETAFTEEYSGNWKVTAGYDSGMLLQLSQGEMGKMWDIRAVLPDPKQAGPMMLHRTIFTPTRGSTDVIDRWYMPVGAYKLDGEAKVEGAYKLDGEAKEVKEEASSSRRVSGRPSRVAPCDSHAVLIGRCHRSKPRRCPAPGRCGLSKKNRLSRSSPAYVLPVANSCCARSKRGCKLHSSCGRRNFKRRCRGICQ
ncbi:MAG: hypothetical protein KVP17_004534 [Porospora cf. gigantea B]|uniref:uncharacterized protein n=1 Tax=Porospora cf. gigantea B TaxID=2853592 RepID=UPI003571ECC0|nr:MAG: hypothetical protein KVP17_004534 [Porospora cf. gigantea B]